MLETKPEIEQNKKQWNGKCN